MSYQPPVKGYPVTTGYHVPGKWAAGHHTGVDFACPAGTPVYAVAEGDIRTRARRAQYGAFGTTKDHPYGRYVVLNDDVGGDDWLYAHLSKIVVAEGQHVQAGTLLGYTGATGNVTGPHLHFERRPRYGWYGSDKNPVVWAATAVKPAVKAASSRLVKAPAKAHNPLTDDELVAALLAEGCKILQTANWRTHNRNHKGDWGRINGIMVHHTGSDAQSHAYLVSGSQSLPGPLCHFGIRMDGTVVLISNGRANHAGGGDPAVLSRVIREDQSLMKGEARPKLGNSNGVDGNSHYYGLEVMYDGGQPMTAAQEDATVRVCAAIARAFGWSAASVIGHREWSSDKWDPGKESMTDLRAQVQARLNKTTVAAAAAKQQEDDMDYPTFAAHMDRYGKELYQGKRGEAARNYWSAIPWHAGFGKDPRTGALRRPLDVIRELVKR